MIKNFILHLSNLLWIEWFIARKGRGRTNTFTWAIYVILVISVFFITEVNNSEHGNYFRHFFNVQLLKAPTSPYNESTPARTDNWDGS